MQITLLQSGLFAGASLAAGDVVNVPRAEALALIGRGWAAAVDVRELAQLPDDRNAVLAALGPSTVFQMRSDPATATQYYYAARGSLAHLLAAAQGSLHTPLGHILGVSGEDSGGIRARAPQVLALSPLPGWCIYHGPINDVIDGRSPLLTKADIAATLQLLIAGGVRVIVVPCPPCPDFTAAKHRAAQLINEWLRDYCARYPGRLFFVPVNSDLVDPASADGAGYAVDFNTDQVHLFPPGGRKEGVAAYLAIRDYLNANVDFHEQLRSVWSSTNPLGALVANATMEITTGGTIGTGIDAGSVMPQGWRAERASGTVVTAATSVIDRWDGRKGKAVRMVLTSAGGGTGNAVFYIRTATSSLTDGWFPGARIFATSLQRVGAHTQGLVSFSEAQLRDNANSLTVGSMTGAAGWTWPSDEYVSRPRSPTYAVPANATNYSLRHRIEIDQSIAGAVTIDVTDLAPLPTLLAA